MKQSSTISFERLPLKIRKITFVNPPANLMLPETVAHFDLDLSCSAIMKCDESFYCM
ncbi:hypothetical protein OHA25_44915 [Nonomuraea sp. NBC_00507]|uniref:hypothetical protein n=1 Tax=Nonomuraea sp. NBC_00507 TaxID=2976002 RepID=UPI002E197D5B